MIASRAEVEAAFQNRATEQQEARSNEIRRLTRNQLAIAENDPPKEKRLPDKPKLVEPQQARDNKLQPQNGPSSIISAPNIVDRADTPKLRVDILKFEKLGASDKTTPNKESVRPFVEIDPPEFSALEPSFVRPLPIQGSVPVISNLTQEPVNLKTVHQPSNEAGELAQSELFSSVELQDDLSQFFDKGIPSLSESVQAFEQDNELAGFDDGLIDLHSQLAAFYQLEIAERQDDTTLQAVDLVEGEFAVLNVEDEANPKEDFEDIFLAQPAPEIPPSLESITAEASGQVLEKTFIQLGFHLAESTHEKNYLDEALNEALHAVIEHMPADSVSVLETKISPELTNKLLTLLRAVGYENPHKALLAFLRDHSFEYLLQTIKYLYQLSDDTNRKEFASSLPASLLLKQADEPISAKLGKAIVYLLTTLDQRVAATTF